MHFLGSGEPRPLPYGVPHEPFAISRMLAWNASAASALVVGREAFRRGFYLLDTAPGDGVDAPRYVGPVSGIPYGTFSSTTPSSSRRLTGCSRRSTATSFGCSRRPTPRRRRDRSSGSADGGRIRLGILAAMNVSVVGAGRVGTAMAVLLGRAGHRIVAVAGRGPTRDRASRFLPDVPFLDPADAARAGELVLDRRSRRRHPRDRRTDRRRRRVPFRAVGGPPVGGVGARRPLARASGRCPAARAPSAADVPRRRRRARTHPRVRDGRYRRGRRGLHGRGAHRRRPHGRGRSGWRTRCGRCTTRPPSSPRTTSS